jgi:hypothetical protein
VHGRPWQIDGFLVFTTFHSDGRNLAQRLMSRRSDRDECGRQNDILQPASRV